MKRIFMSFKEYENDMRKSKDEGVSVALYMVVEHLCGRTDLSHTGYADTEQNIRLIKEIKQLTERK